MHIFNKYYSLLVLMLMSLMLLYCSTNCRKQDNDQFHDAVLNYRTLMDAYPYSEGKDAYVLKYSGFELSFNPEHRQANWVIYLHTREKLEGDVKRTNDFRPDPNLGNLSASLDDYKNSGYDRGHLAPAGDMKWSLKAMSESFLLSNISPQVPKFNQGIWLKLEDLMREWTSLHDSIIIITGPILSDNLNHIGANRVSVPDFYYKAVLNISYGKYKAIAFMLRNENSQEPISSFVISIDSLETVSGFDFFHNLNPEVIKPLKRHSEYSVW